MASRVHSRELVDKPQRGDGARVLLVNNNPEDLFYYGGILQRLQCQVRTSSSFAKGAECLKHERYDLIVLDQGGSKFEGRQVLMTAMEVDTEVPVLVLARSYDRGCYEQAMQSGALDYVEGQLSEGEIVAFLETFVPRAVVSRGTSPTRAEAVRPGMKTKSKAQSNSAHPAECVPVS